MQGAARTRTRERARRGLVSQRAVARGDVRDPGRKYSLLRSLSLLLWHHDAADPMGVPEVFGSWRRLADLDQVDAHEGVAVAHAQGVVIAVTRDDVVQVEV